MSVCASREAGESELLDRLRRVEDRLARSEPRPGRGWEAAKVLLPLFQALLLAGVAYFATQRVSNAIQQRQLDLSHVKEMRELLLQLQTPGAGGSDLEAAAVTLAAFGDYAVAPLINVIEVGSATDNLGQVLAAEKGLRAVGWVHPAPVCAGLQAAIRNRTRMFNWQTHLSAVRLLGDLACREARGDLLALERRIGGGSPAEALPALLAIVEGSRPPSAAAVKQMREALEASLRILEEAS